MNGKIIVCIVFLSAFAFFLFSAENQGKKAKSEKNSILIVKDSSDLEIAVSRIVVDSLSKLGYTVKEISLADIGKEDASSYKVSIVFSAITTGDEIDPRVEKFKTSGAGTSSEVLLFTVWGEVYNEHDEKVDATTEASKALHPPLIAEHILRSLNLR